MRLSTRVRYGARALAELAGVYPQGTMAAHDIASRQDLSVKYLETIMTALKTADIVRSVRGAGGGYALARPPRQITLGEVYAALEGDVAPVACLDDPQSCPHQHRCPTFDTWMEIRDAIEGVLARTTLDDLARRRTCKTKASAPMYYI